MKKNILVISGSPKKNGNTATLINWFCEGISSKADVEVVNAAFLKTKTKGCMACRACQKRKAYECVIKDEVAKTLTKMAKADIIVFATPLFFFSMSAQLKSIVDRMFSLAKWDNEANTMQTVLKGKTLVVIASAYEDIGLKELEAPFKLTADYTGMKYASLLVPNAGESGELKDRQDVRRKARAFGERVAGR